MDLSGDRLQTLPLSLVVADLHEAASGVVSLILRDVRGVVLPEWAPGAHIEILLPNGIVRQYSLCGDTGDAEQWRISVLNVPEGRGGSKFIHEKLAKGDILQASEPRNNFLLEPAEDYLFIAGGIGITPLLPMIRRVADEGRRWTLLYGGRERRSMAYLDEIELIAGGDVFIRPQDQYGILDLKAVLHEHTPRRLVYCCGPGALIDAVEEQCAHWPKGTLHRERFTPRTRETILEDGEFEVELARSGRRIRIASDQSLLSALEDAGCKITNSCRAGICGTCLVDVLGGVPDHLDDVLTDEQRESGKVMLPCVSRSKTPILILDL